MKPSSSILTTGPVWRSLYRMTIPMLFGIGGMILFNLIDTWFIAQLGTTELAAISFTFPVVLLASSIALGLGTGATAVISRTIGSGQTDKVQRTTVDALLLSIVIVSGFVIIGLLTMEPLFRMLGSGDNTIHLTIDYMKIWYPGAVFVVIPMVGNSAIRATGDIKTTSLIMMVSIVINIILDPLLIFGYGPFPRMEMEGAALASVIARATTLVAALLILHFKHRMLTFTAPKFTELKESWRLILRIGIPSSTTKVIVPLSMMFITRIVAEHGIEAVAGFGIATRIEAIGTSLFMAHSAIIIPFVGQNLGAGTIGRIHESVTKSTLFALTYGLLLFTLFFFGGDYFASLFDSSKTVIAVAHNYLIIVSLSYGLAGILMINSSVFNGLNKPSPTLYLSLSRMLIFYLPLALLGSYLWGLIGIFAGCSLANALSGAWAHFWLKQELKIIERYDD